MKKVLILMVVGISAFAALAEDEARVIVRSGEIVVTDTELEAAVESLPEEIRQYASGPGKKSFAEDLLRMKRLADAAEESGLADDPEIRAQLELSRANTLANAQVEKMRESIAIDPERTSRVYEERKGQFERAKARHILIAFEGSPAAGEDAPTDEEARAHAEKLLERIRGGEDFAAVAQAESDDKGSGARGGELGEFGRGQMVAAFEEAVFSTEAGEIAPVVKTQFGYHIINVQDRKTLPLESVREDIETELRQEALQQLIESLDEETEVTFDPEYFGSEEAPTVAE